MWLGFRGCSPQVFMTSRAAARAHAEWGVGGTELEMNASHEESRPVVTKHREAHDAVDRHLSNGPATARPRSLRRSGEPSIPPTKAGRQLPRWCRTSKDEAPRHTVPRTANRPWPL